jgi:hypothetical protein
VCLKTTSKLPCRDIRISGCQLCSHWAALKFGTESVGDFEDIRISDCHIRDTQGGGLKLLAVDGANVRNVVISGLTMEDVNVPIFMRLGARLKTFRAGDQPQPVGSISNVVIRNVRARCNSPVAIAVNGIPGHPVQDLTLEQIDIQLPGGGTRADADLALEEKETAYPELSMFGKRWPAYGIFARHVNGLTARQVKLEPAQPDARPAILCQDVEHLELTDWALPADAEADVVRFASVRQALVKGFALSGPRAPAFLALEGAGTERIQLKDNHLGETKQVIRLGAEVKPASVSAD